MKVEILDEAQNDLLDGFRFYENQSEGLGDYFLDSLFSDIDSLQIYAGVTQCISGITGFSPDDSLSPSTIASPVRQLEFMPFLIAGGTRRGFGIDSHRPRTSAWNPTPASLRSTGEAHAPRSAHRRRFEREVATDRRSPASLLLRTEDVNH